MSNAELIGQDPGWVIALKGALIFAVCVFLTIMSVWGERELLQGCNKEVAQIEWVSLDYYKH